MIILVFILALIFSTPAIAVPHGGATPACPVGSPSPDGSIIIQQAPGQVSCVLIEFTGTWWRYNGVTLQDSNNNGTSWTDFSSGFPKFEISQSGHAFFSASCLSQSNLWLVDTPGVGLSPNVIDPNHAILPNPFTDTTQSISSAGLDALTAGGLVHDGDTISIGALPVGGVPGIWFTSGRIRNNNLTITGTKFGCTAILGNAALLVDTTDFGPLTGITVSVSEVAGVKCDTCRGIGFQSSTNWTVSGVYIHDNSFGLEADSTAGGAVHITNTDFDHNGIGSGPPHNVYLGSSCFSPPCNWSTLTSPVIVSGHGSYCVGTAGFQFKSRYASATFTNWTAAEPSQHGFNIADCLESAAVDFACGGQNTLGGVGAGTGVVLELGQNSINQGHAVVRVGDNLLDGTGDCSGAAVVPWPHGGDTVIQNAIIIIDQWDAVHPPFVCDNHVPSTGTTCTVKNSKIVANDNITYCDGTHDSQCLGPNTTNGGGNTYFQDRTAAGYAAFPFLPSPP